MNIREDTFRVKEEPNDSWPDVGSSNNLDSVNTRERKNVETFTCSKSSANYKNEVMALHEGVDEKIFIDLEFKHLKLEETSPSTTICKNEYQICSSVVKVEKKIQTNYSIDRDLIILIKKDFDNENNCQFREKSPKLEKGTIIELKTQTKSFSKHNLKSDQNRHISTVHDRKKPFECDTCHKSFGRKYYLKTHINVLHNRSKLLVCEICLKSFSFKTNLTRHIDVVHTKKNTFQCEFCQKLFGRKYNLKIHINAIHDRSKHFECEICHKSFGRKCHLKAHISTVHVQSKPFECRICHKSFGDKSTFNKHISAVHDRSKPFECEICHKSFSMKSNQNRHISTVHDRKKPFECEICLKSFSLKGNLTRHINVVHNKKKTFCM